MMAEKVYNFERKYQSFAPIAFKMKWHWYTAQAMAALSSTVKAAAVNTETTMVFFFEGKMYIKYKLESGHAIR